MQTWAEILALLINGAGVAVALRLIQGLIPQIEARAPWLVPILAGGFGPVVAALQGKLSALLGVPIDLSPLLSLASGTTAFLFHVQRTRVRNAGGRWLAPRPMGSILAILLSVAMLGAGCAEITTESPGCNARASAGGGGGGGGSTPDAGADGAPGGSASAESGCSPGKTTVAQKLFGNKLTQ